MSAACQYLSLCKKSDVSEGKAIKIEKNGLTLAVFNLNGEYYVTDDVCTHGPGSLSEELPTPDTPQPQELQGVSGAHQEQEQKGDDQIRPKSDLTAKAHVFLESQLTQANKQSQARGHEDQRNQAPRSYPSPKNGQQFHVSLAHAL